ncbi:hypothetical protein JXA59_01070 [Patescibacteria group bacterium]|nr:hypothetical protein [Patescibacteria group bacterium]
MGKIKEAAPTAMYPLIKLIPTYPTTTSATIQMINLAGALNPDDFLVAIIWLL